MFALTQDGILASWNIVTNKLISKKKLDEHDYNSDYSIVSYYKKGMVCIRSNEDVED
jgi:hypothetical protein